MSTSNENLFRQERMATLGQLASGIAHELSNPLTAVLGYAAQLLKKPLAPPARAEVEKIYREADRATRIVRNLLHLARGVHPEKRAVNLNRLVKETIDLRRYEWSVNNIEISLELDPRLPETQADTDQLQQVLLNLLLNAEQAILSDRQRGSIRVRSRWDASAGKIRVEIVDDGPGIDPVALPRIFEPFFTTKPLGEGTGLGLSVSRDIVQGHRGNLAVESKPASGATFTIELPVVSAPAAKPFGSERLAPPSTLRGRILVVDDEALVVELVSDILRQDGHQVEATTDPQRALEMAAGEFDLVICDLAMPGLDGEALFHALKERGSPLAERILFTTGDLHSRRTARFLFRTGAPFLPKPFRVEELRQVVRDLLQTFSAHGRDERSATLTSSPEEP